MTAHRAIADRVRVSFSNGTSTVITVLDDESIQDAIVDLCEKEGWDVSEVDGYRIIGQVYADEYGVD